MSRAACTCPWPRGFVTWMQSINLRTFSPVASNTGMSLVVFNALRLLSGRESEPGAERTGPTMGQGAVA